MPTVFVFHDGVDSGELPEFEGWSFTGRGGTGHSCLPYEFQMDTAGFEWEGEEQVREGLRSYMQVQKAAGHIVRFYVHVGTFPRPSVFPTEAECE